MEILNMAGVTRIIVKEGLGEISERLRQAH
jgi:hypothetical protein